MLDSTSLIRVLQNVQINHKNTSENYFGKTVLQNSTPKQLKTLRAVRTETNLSPQSCCLCADNSCTRDTSGKQVQHHPRLLLNKEPLSKDLKYMGTKGVRGGGPNPCTICLFSPSVLLSWNQSASCTVPHHWLAGVCSNARGLVNLQKALSTLISFF